MPGPGSNNDDFASTLQKAQQPPAVANNSGKDLPDMFPPPQGAHHRVVDTTNDPTAIEGLVAYDFKCKREVFLIYRPYDSCNRCAQMIANDVTLLPAAGDFTCPHTRVRDYEAIQDKILKAEFLGGGETEVTQKDGSIVISVKWYEKTLNPGRAKAAAAAAARAQATGRSVT